MLAELARDVTGWDAHAVEFFQRLACTQYINHLRPQSLGTADVRRLLPLDSLNEPFETVPRRVDVRRTAGGRGRCNIPNIGIYIWRLRSYSLHASPAFKLDDRRYLFNPLGAGTRLFSRPQEDAGSAAGAPGGVRPPRKNSTAPTRASSSPASPSTRSTSAISPTRPPAPGRTPPRPARSRSIRCSAASRSEPCPRRSRPSHIIMASPTISAAASMIAWGRSTLPSSRS
jgi:hypothetical protein